MSIVLAALIVSSQPLPFIDRPALRTLAKAEAAQVRRALPVQASSVRDDRTIDLCDTAPSPRVATGRAYSMFGPRVSILETTCAQRRSLAAKPTGIRIAAR